MQTELKTIVVSDAQIAQRAYQLWESRGCPISDGVEDWKTAEAELLAEINNNLTAQQTSKQSLNQEVPPANLIHEKGSGVFKRVLKNLFNK